MAKVECPKCGHNFEGSSLKGAAAATASAALGAKIGAGFGIAGGPLGAIAGTIPGAIIGGVTGYLASNKFYQCDCCDKYFML
ncbi:MULTISPECIES: hypothetical protein [unclassified Shewanella]|uniref:hypothetical protein n=1 Tax=unclassified Shewanella TaxID=196818 RepID=UPI000C85E0D0|nr:MULTISPECIES: hypothetical protein [unclassified Shewanella]MDO6774344.1 hypothetical protein [Shewanella sp. 3_MG-2023]PMG51080.1 hypothetical protein BCU91_16930 [Shewanella sp. 10N.286.52.B9]